ncbi:MAG: hypothetical protein WBQ95_02355 [Terracidiphilus sp.]
MHLTKDNGSERGESSAEAGRGNGHAANSSPAAAAGYAAGVSQE